MDINFVEDLMFWNGFSHISALNFSWWKTFIPVMFMQSFPSFLHTILEHNHVNFNFHFLHLYTGFSLPVYIFVNKLISVKRIFMLKLCKIPKRPLNSIISMTTYSYKHISCKLGSHLPIVHPIWYYILGILQWLNFNRIYLLHDQHRWKQQ